MELVLSELSKADQELAKSRDVVDVKWEAKLQADRRLQEALDTTQRKMDHVQQIAKTATELAEGIRMKVDIYENIVVPTQVAVNNTFQNMVDAQSVMYARQHAAMREVKD